MAALRPRPSHTDDSRPLLSTGPRPCKAPLFRRYRSSALHVASPPRALWWIARFQRRTTMIKFLGKTAGIIFLIGLAVVIGLLMLIF